MNLSPVPVQKFFDNNGRPLAGGQLFTYAAGTNDKIDTWKDAAGSALNTNPIELDFRGECRLWIDPTLAYKFVLARRGDTDPPGDPIWTVDNITAGPAQQDNAATDAGSVNNISLSIPQISSPVAFTRIVFKAANTNTGPVTISINGGTAHDLTWQNIGAFRGNEIQENGVYQTIFDGAQWQLQGPSLMPTQITTPAENAELVTPTNYVYLEGEAFRYGALGDDSFDNSTALQDAIDVMSAGGGGAVIIGVGTFRFGSTLTIKAGVSLIGQGFGATVLSYTGSGVAIVTEAPGLPNSNDSTLQGFQVRTTTGTHGIRLLNAREVVIDGVEVRGFSTAGIHLQATTGDFVGYITITNRCHIHENGYGILCGDVNGAINNITIHNSAIRANETANIYSNFDMLAWSVVGNALEGSGASGVAAVYLAGIQGLELSGNYFEQPHAKPAVWISENRPSYGLSITGNYIQGPGAAGTGIQLGTSAFVYGAEVSGNFISGWSIGVAPGAVQGGEIGPNYIANVTTSVSTPGGSARDLVVIDGSSVKTYNAPISQLSWDGSAWNGFPKHRYVTVQLGNVAYGSVGTNTTPVAGTIYYAEVFIDRAKTLSGAGFLVGSVGTNNSFIVSLYSATGTLLANSTLAGVTTGGANVISQSSFTSTYAAPPGKYWIGVQLNGTTDRIRTIPNDLFIDVPLTTAVAGVFGTLPNLAPPATFTPDLGPIAYVY